MYGSIVQLFKESFCIGQLAFLWKVSLILCQRKTEYIFSWQKIIVPRKTMTPPENNDSTCSMLFGPNRFSIS